MIDLTPGKGRKEAPLPKSLSGRLKDYALMAGAAGVGVMALAPGAQAGIIYNPGGLSTTLASGACPGGGATCFEQAATVFTINGLNELTFGDTYKSNPNTHTQFASLGVASFTSHAPGGAGVMTSFLAAGALIGPGKTFTSSTKLAGQQWTKTNSATPVGSAALGAWAAHIGQTGYLGFEFNNGGTIDYGWLKLTISETANHDIQAVINGWAYNNTGQAIDAGQGIPAAAEPGLPSLLLLSLGSLGLGAWRRKKQTQNA
jgi:hypothetical protein